MKTSESSGKIATDLSLLPNTRFSAQHIMNCHQIRNRWWGWGFGFLLFIFQKQYLREGLGKQIHSTEQQHCLKLAEHSYVGTFSISNSSACTSLLGWLKLVMKHYKSLHIYTSLELLCPELLNTFWQCCCNNKMPWCKSGAWRRKRAELFPQNWPTIESWLYTIQVPP